MSASMWTVVLLALAAVSITLTVRDIARDWRERR